MAPRILFHAALLGAASTLPFFHALWSALAEAGLQRPPLPLLPLLAALGAGIAMLLATTRQSWPGGLLLGTLLAGLLSLAIPFPQTPGPESIGALPGRIRIVFILLAWSATLGFCAHILRGSQNPPR